jgi:hypothetical protein
MGKDFKRLYMIQRDFILEGPINLTRIVNI